MVRAGLVADFGIWISGFFSKRRSTADACADIAVSTPRALFNGRWVLESVLVVVDLGIFSDMVTNIK